ncbi:MAG: heme o synthase [Halodesulfurarchaeum sp.]
MGGPDAAESEAVHSPHEEESLASRFRELATTHFTLLLAASTIGVYLMVLVGTTTSLLDAGSACASWPTCNGGLLPAGEATAVLAWGHRLVGLVVGLVLIATVFASVWEGDRRIRMGVAVAAFLYPIQTGLGAWMALFGVSRAASAIHLVVAMTIFSGLLVALLWRLEAEHVEPGPRQLAPSQETKAVSKSAVEGVPSDDGEGPLSVRDGQEIGAGAEGGSRTSPSIGTRLRAYLTLTKPRLWWLLALVAVAAMALAAGPTLHIWTVVATVTGGVLAIGASGTFNNILETDRDRRMERTKDRPLVEGTISIRRAIAFGALLTVASWAVFAVFVNVLAAALGMLAILFYSVIYTLLLKPHTDQNIVIGGAVGAFPALIGWAAVEHTIELPAIVLGTIVFLWTPAHFYNLALAYREDYARAGFPMLPVSRGAATTRRHILLYLGATMVATVFLGTSQALGWTYAGAVLVVGGVFLWTVIQQYRVRTDDAALRTFHAVNAYLGVLLLAVVIDSLLVP